MCSACAPRPVYLPRGASALPAPLGSFLPRQWDAGVISAQPSWPRCRGLAGGGFLLQGRGWLCPGRLHLYPSRSGGLWRQGQTPPPPARVISWDGPVMCPGFPASRAKQSWSSDPVPQCGVSPRKEHPSGWQKGPSRPVLFPPPRVWPLSSWGPRFLAVFSLRLSNKAWCSLYTRLCGLPVPFPPGPQASRLGPQALGVTAVLLTCAAGPAPLLLTASQPRNVAGPGHTAGEGWSLRDRAVLRPTEGALLGPAGPGDHG